VVITSVYSCIYDIKLGQDFVVGFNNEDERYYIYFRNENILPGRSCWNYGFNQRHIAVETINQKGSKEYYLIDKLLYQVNYGNINNIGIVGPIDDSLTFLDMLDAVGVTLNNNLFEPW
jgi:hypothetical protein